MSISDVLLGKLPSALVKAARKQREKERRQTDEYKKSDREKKARRYATDPEYRERFKQDQRDRRAAATPEQKAADYARRKAITASLPEAEYQRRRELALARQRKWREKKKMRNGES